MLSSPDFPGYIFCTAQSELPGGSSSTSSCVSGIFTAVDIYGSLIGGTSVAAPVFAGIVALLNQDVVQSGIQSTPGLGNINPTLYSLAVSSPTAFHHVTTGDNLVYCQPTLPVGQPSNIVCPAAVAPATQGVIGYQASNKDSATGYNLVAGLGSVDAKNLASAWVGTGTAATTTTLTSSPNPSSFGATVTFTATVTTTGSTPPTGNVTFYDGTTSLGTGTLNGAQVATFATATLAPPTQAITATYAGDSNNAASTSAILTQNIAAPTFKFSTPTTPAAVLAGGSTTSTFTVTPTSAGTFVAAVTFPFCTGLPDATVTCSVNTGQPANPTQIAANSGPTVVTLTLTTTGPNSSSSANKLQRRADNRSPWLPLALPLAGIVMVGFAGRKMSKYSVVACLSVSLVLLGLLVACGGSSSAPPVAVSVALAPGSSSTVFPNYAADAWPSQSANFTATVTNTTNTAVNWSLSSSVSCTAASSPCGSITSAGAYTAPTIAAGLPTKVTIIATSQADQTKTGQAVENITPTTVPTAVVGAPYSITVAASEGGVASNTTSAILLTVQ